MIMAAKFISGKYKFKVKKMWHCPFKFVYHIPLVFEDVDLKEDGDQFVQEGLEISLDVLQLST